MLYLTTVSHCSFRVCIFNEENHPQVPFLSSYSLWCLLRVRWDWGPAFVPAGLPGSVSLTFTNVGRLLPDVSIAQVE